jgi:hypothetical protein
LQLNAIQQPPEPSLGCKGADDDVAGLLSLEWLREASDEEARDYLLSVEGERPHACCDSLKASMQSYTTRGSGRWPLRRLLLQGWLLGRLILQGWQ